MKKGDNKEGKKFGSIGKTILLLLAALVVVVLALSSLGIIVIRL